MKKCLFLVAVTVMCCPIVLFAEEKTQPDEKVLQLANEIKDKGWIIYSAVTDNNNWDIFICRPDGSQRQNLTNTSDWEEAGPRFSPDGTKILYRRVPKGVIVSHEVWGVQGQLMLANADASNPVVLGDTGKYTWASWSPDGQQISCLTAKEIQIVDIATKKVVRTLPRKGIYQMFYWSPDGKWFCGVANNLGDVWTIARMNAETGGLNCVRSSLNYKDAGGSCTPDWFPDSKTIIFSSRPTNQKGYGWTQLWSAAGDGNDQKLLYGEDGSHIYGGAVSPDGKYILFSKCPNDGGGALQKTGAPICVIRLSDTPMITGESADLRKLHPVTKGGPVLEWHINGWEPHWTYAEIGAKK